MKDIKIQDYTYQLPPDRIAEFPLDQRDQSRLLHYRSGDIEDRYFAEMPSLVPGPALMVLNNTRVIEARIFFQKPTGGTIEIFCLEPAGANLSSALGQKGTTDWLCLIGGASKWKPGQVLQKELAVNHQSFLLEARYLAKEGDSFLIRFNWQPDDLSFEEVIHHAGQIPLPPYIKRLPEAEDADRYQTVFHKEPGSVAAPTAALHFTPGVLQQLEWKKVEIAYLTLHVGAGTFKPVKSETIGGHAMHAEPFSISKGTLLSLLNAPFIVAVGTTSLRTLESLYWMGIKLLKGLPEPFLLQQWEVYDLPDDGVKFRAVIENLCSWMESKGLEEIQGRTSLIIVPGYRFRVAEALVTNFHQPQSTLLLLVAAFVGPDWKKIYQHALENGYRFLSYGDSSLLWRQS